MLFDRVAVPMAEPGTKGAWLRGWRVMAVDGVVLDVPDTPDNRKVFDRRGDTAFPQARAVGLGECGTHAIVAAAFDSWRVQERELLHRILDRMEPGMLVLADRGFYGYDMWTAAAATGADLLWRVTDTVELPVSEWLPDGSYRSFLLPKHVRNNLGRGKSHFRLEELRVQVRVVEYMVTDRGPSDTIRLITTITDPDHAAAAELAALYRCRSKSHRRW
ncbi:IS4 family transposase [Actinosynnema sp. NPDC050801]|uniref:IS4 family transposase n=1 Tax=unclassified Actinosynnema TaxID=2637065 RepID=UPI00340C6DCD